MNRSKLSWWVCMTLPIIFSQVAIAFGEEPLNAEAAASCSHLRRANMPRHRCGCGMTC